MAWEKSFAIQSLEEMAPLRMEFAGEVWDWTPNQDRIVLFYTNSIFSNFYPTTFFLDGEQFYSVEHYYQLEKAKYFGDEKTAAKMRATKNPWKHKRLGNKVKGFSESAWQGPRIDAMIKACEAKFTQDDYLWERLQETGKGILAEASPHCKFWGIGLKRWDKASLDHNKWKGKNVLGNILMRIRDEMI